MSKSPDVPAQLVNLTAELHEAFPKADLSWDTKVSPYLLTLNVNGIKIRACIEHAEVEQRGPLYDRLKARLQELVISSLSRTPSEDWRMRQPH